MDGGLWPADGVEEERASFAREVFVDASPQEVWQAIATDDGRAGWLECEEERDVEVELAEAPWRLAWWWLPEGEQERTRVEFVLRAVAEGTLLTVRESAPRLPLQMLARMSLAVLA